MGNYTSSNNTSSARDNGTDGLMVTTNTSLEHVVIDIKTVSNGIRFNGIQNGVHGLLPYVVCALIQELFAFACGPPHWVKDGGRDVCV